MDKNCPRLLHSQSALIPTSHPHSKMGSYYCSTDRSLRVHGREPSGAMLHLPPRWRQDHHDSHPPGTQARNTQGWSGPRAYKQPSRPCVTNSDPRTFRVSSHALHTPHHTLHPSTPVRSHLKTGLHFVVRPDSLLQKLEQHL